MTSRLNESSGGNCSPRSETRPNQVSMTSQPGEEGCPVIEESGTVCGETRTLNVFQEFRQKYDECIRKMEGNKEENLALRKLAPFRKLVEDLWEQNAMLVETVQELEQEATCRVAVLQNKLDQCCQKVAENLESMNEVVNEYLEDIDSLVEVIRRFRKKGVIDSSGLKFNTICDFEIHGRCKSSCSLVKGTRSKEKSRDINEDIGEDTGKCLRKERDTRRDGSDTSPSSEPGRSASRHSDASVKRRGSVAGKEDAKKGCKCLESECDDGELFSTPSDDLSLESLLRETCELIEADQSKSMSKTRSDPKSEGSGFAESFHSAEDCTAGGNGKKEDALGLVKASSDKCLQSTQVAPDGTGCSSDCSRPININLNLISEPSCYGRMDVENLLKQKDREICCLAKELSGKNELLGKYYSQIDDLKRDMKARSRKYQQMLNRLKDAAIQRLSKLPEGDLKIGDDCDEGATEILFNTVLREMDNQKVRCAKRIEESNCLLKEMSKEKSQILSDKTDMGRDMEELESENRALKNELAAYKNVSAENEGLNAKLVGLTEERDRLLEKVHNLHHSMKELDSSFKETRWALTSEVAEKHDQIQELRRHLACLEEQVRQADMKALFKDDVIKEMRKELKNTRTAVYRLDTVTNNPIPGSPLTMATQPRDFEKPVRDKAKEEDLKLDICIFPMKQPGNDDDDDKSLSKLGGSLPENLSSVEVQTDIMKKLPCKTRNVSTQHTTRVEKLPRSFGTLTVTPWSGSNGEGPTFKPPSRVSVKSKKAPSGNYGVACSNPS